MTRGTDHRKKSRRSFIGHTILGSAGIALGWMIGKIIREKKTDTIKLMAPDGSLVEVPKHQIRTTSKQKASIKELKKWMNTRSESDHNHSL